ncbi:P-loop containing nucleoside triphosphate hydrolase protein [Clathrospora elynae]|uniref:protein-synthesizing GTPase n=1 Tax=Clathrospora elynae TaxID=706981 RepID=A0A6A5SHN1_9PLEO|nr:P-loop containing nucleoside triphosphate hydrolase protein [Clathrospora elynae]
MYPSPRPHSTTLSTQTAGLYLPVGTIGQVDHGKSTLVRAITGTKTMRHETEMARNITIKFGYAAAKIYNCKQSMEGRKCQGEGYDGSYEPVRKISIVDSPVREILMRAMLMGTSVMDAALLIISAEEECPQPQTWEHLTTIETLRLTSVVMVQSKLDRMAADTARKYVEQVRAFLKGTSGEDAPIVPVSTQFGISIDVVHDMLVSIPLPVRDITSSARMRIVCSFDSSIAGGTLLEGVIRIDDDIEIRPGLISHDRASAMPGGLIGVRMLVAPELCRGDQFIGQVLGLRGTLPPIFSVISVQFEILRRTTNRGEHRETERIRTGEVKCHEMELVLNSSVYADLGEKVTLSKLDKRWRLAGWGVVVERLEAEMRDC